MTSSSSIIITSGVVLFAGYHAVCLSCKLVKSLYRLARAVAVPVLFTTWMANQLRLSPPGLAVIALSLFFLQWKKSSSAGIEEQQQCQQQTRETGNGCAPTIQPQVLSTDEQPTHDLDDVSDTSSSSVRDPEDRLPHNPLSEDDDDENDAIQQYTVRNPLHQDVEVEPQQEDRDPPRPPPFPVHPHTLAKIVNSNKYLTTPDQAESYWKEHYGDCSTPQRRSNTKVSFDDTASKPGTNITLVYVTRLEQEKLMQDVEDIYNKCDEMGDTWDQGVKEAHGDDMIFSCASRADRLEDERHVQDWLVQREAQVLLQTMLDDLRRGRPLNVRTFCETVAVAHWDAWGAYCLATEHCVHDIQDVPGRIDNAYLRYFEQWVSTNVGVGRDQMLPTYACEASRLSFESRIVLGVRAMLHGESVQDLRRDAFRAEHGKVLDQTQPGMILHNGAWERFYRQDVAVDRVRTIMFADEVEDSDKGYPYARDDDVRQVFLEDEDEDFSDDEDDDFSDEEEDDDEYYLPPMEMVFDCEDSEFPFYSQEEKSELFQEIKANKGRRKEERKRELEDANGDYMLLYSMTPPQLSLEPIILNNDLVPFEDKTVSTTRVEQLRRDQGQRAFHDTIPRAVAVFSLRLVLLRYYIDVASAPDTAMIKAIPTTTTCRALILYNPGCLRHDDSVSAPNESLCRARMVCTTTKTTATATDCRALVLYQDTGTWLVPYDASLRASNNVAQEVVGCRDLIPYNQVCQDLILFSNQDCRDLIPFSKMRRALASSSIASRNRDARVAVPLTDRSRGDQLKKQRMVSMLLAIMKICHGLDWKIDCATFQDEPTDVDNSEEILYGDGSIELNGLDKPVLNEKPISGKKHTKRRKKPHSSCPPRRSARIAASRNSANAEHCTPNVPPCSRSSTRRAAAVKPPGFKYQK